MPAVVQKALETPFKEIKTTTLEIPTEEIKKTNPIETKPQIPQTPIEKEEKTKFEVVETVDNRTDLEKEKSEIIGKKAEQFVFDKLNEKYKGTNAQIIWHRQAGQTYHHCDFTITENGKETFVEVKATISADDTTIYLSPAEWELMLNSPQRYILARVFNANNPSEVIWVNMNNLGKF